MNHDEYMKAIDECEGYVRSYFQKLDKERSVWQMENAIREGFMRLRMEIDERLRIPITRDRKYFWQGTDIVNASTNAARQILFGTIRENERCITDAPTAIVNAVRRHYVRNPHWDNSDNDACKDVRTYLEEWVLPRIASAISIEMSRAETDRLFRVEFGHQL